MQINRRFFALLAILLTLGLLAASGELQRLYLSLLLATQGAQRLFHDEIADKLKAIKETHSFMATGGLVFIGFLYGALHAIGPGHGKIIVGSYLLASKSCLRRGIVVTFLASLLQACVAIALVFGLMAIFGLTRGQTEQTALKLESFSFGLLALVGAALLGRGIKELWNVFHHRREKGIDVCSCGHVHAPEPQKLNNIHDIASLAGMVFSIGLRPCSGAILLLLFSGLVGVYGAGILATFAMAFGTALTTGALAVLTVHSKTWALRLTQTEGDRLRFLHAGLAVGGGILIILFGTAFLLANSAAVDLRLQSDGIAIEGSHPLMKALGK
jgi:ABC-type nickel/cobalt efflux system permease component RcnA